MRNIFRPRESYTLLQLFKENVTALKQPEIRVNEMV